MSAWAARRRARRLRRGPPAPVDGKWDDGPSLSYPERQTAALEQLAGALRDLANVAHAQLVAPRPPAEQVPPLSAPDALELIDQHDSPLGNRRHVALCRDGTLPHVKLGRRWCVKRADLDRYLSGSPCAANDAPPAADPDAKLAAELGLRIVKPLSISAPRATGSKRGKP